MVAPLHAHRRAPWRPLLIALAWLAWLAMGPVAAARPGGGHTYGGGTSHASGHTSSGSTSHSSGHTFGGNTSYSSSRPSHYPSGPSSWSSDDPRGGSPEFPVAARIGLGILLGLISIFLVVSFAHGTRASDDQAPAASPIDVEPLRALDDAFSAAVFEDFVFRLYAEAYLAARAPARLAALAPYVEPAAATAIAARTAHPVVRVVIGSLRTIGGDRVRDQGPDAPTWERLFVRIESNLTDDRDRTHAAVDVWTLRRRAGIASPAPTRVRSWPCPVCGAPWARAADATGPASPLVTCASCGVSFAMGERGWALGEVSGEPLAVVATALTGTTEEQGTDLPTLVSERRTTSLAALAARDPAFDEGELASRVTLIHGRLGAAWNAGDLAPVRGLVTAALLDYLRFSLAPYQAARLRNRVDGAEVTTVIIADAATDRYYDAITVRVFAHGRDYTLDARDQVVGGSRTEDRPYSEYWTLIRAAARAGRATITPTCPQCGAPLAISDAGDCTHCNAYLASGDFDWILSKIEQDDAYAAPVDAAPALAGPGPIPPPRRGMIQPTQ
jgi:predicted lipid-binding transport protein (Tim44 family)